MSDVPDTFGEWHDITIRVPTAFYEQLAIIADDSSTTMPMMLLEELSGTELFKIARTKMVESGKNRWYEDTDNFPAMLTRIDNPIHNRWVDNKEEFIKLHRQGWRLTTIEEKRRIRDETNI